MRKYHKANKKIYRFIHRYINGTKGVISLFLALLMLPFASIGGALINAARVNSAVAVFDEALCNASNSTLGTYDSFLRKRFGLLAMTQDNSMYGREYTVQDLISDTFEYYMEQNVGVLSNTYIETTTDARGIYPLSDTSILLSEVQEYSKYAIPTKLVMDGLCIDDIINSLSKNMGFAKSVLNTFSSVGAMAQKTDACHDKFNKAIEKLGTCEGEKVAYEIAFYAFETEVKIYNNLVDEMVQKVSECRQAIADANSSVSDSSDAVNSEAEKYPDASAEWNALRNEKDENGNSVDNSDRIKEFEKNHSELKAYIQAQSDLEEAQEQFDIATEDLKDVVEEYQEKLDTQRNVVENYKASYTDAIDAFAASVKAAGDAVIGAQNAYSDAVGAGVDLVNNAASTVYEYQKKGIDSQIDDMKKSKAAAVERDDNTAAYLWDDQITEANDKKATISNEDTFMEAYSAAATSAQDAANQFMTEKYAEKFNSIYLKLTEVKNKVEGYVVESGYETKMSGAGGYYEDSIVIPISGEQVRQLLSNLVDNITKSSFFATVKALIGFIKAIFNFSAWVDPELMGFIDLSVYDSMGGLPSSKDRSDGSPYCLKSPYETEDSQKSEYYKQLLGGYSGGISASSNGMEIISPMNQILADVSALSECLFSGWHWYNLFEKIKALIVATCDLVTHILLIVGLPLVKTIGSNQKLLLAGYVAYNIPNRTTYTGSALTGERYKLPNSGSAIQGYAFYGAETEYIINGNYSEVENQKEIFNKIWIFRFFYDFLFVLCNREVSSIAGAAGHVSFGIGTLVVYMLYFVAEPFVDTLILVNCGNIPIWKSRLYLTPSGVEDLIKAFYKLKLTEAQKNTAYATIVEVMGNGRVSEDSAQKFADAYQSGIEDPNKLKKPDVVDSLTFDYTKTLLLYMVVFGNEEKMLERLADVIQMEASYYHASPALGGIGTYTFNLDESYTYLRVSGSFTMNEFMPISDATGLRSKQRVIYRGY